MGWLVMQNFQNFQMEVYQLGRNAPSIWNSLWQKYDEFDFLQLPSLFQILCVCKKCFLDSARIH